MGMLKNIGIEKGKDFAPAGEQKKLLEMAIRDTHTYLKTFYLDYAADPYYEGKNWSNASPGGSATTYMTWQYPNYIDYVIRDLGYYAFYTSFKKLGTASAYLKVSRDKEGKRLNGSNSYKLTVPKDVPLKDFWSVIAYTADDATWFDNQPKAGVASIDAGVVQNPDGTTDVYFSAKAPERKEANWVPTTEGMDYFLYFRLYGPKGPFFDKSWQLPDLVKIQ